MPLVTYAAPIADEPIGEVGGSSFAGVPIAAAVGIGGGGSGGGTTPTTPGVIVPGAIPEAPVWLMMIGGVGALGASLRFRRRRAGSPASSSRRIAGRGIAGGALWSGSVAVEAGDMAATVAVKSAVASAAGKAMLCVCPAIVAAGTVMTVPPLRQAVHAATLAPEPAAPAAVTTRAAPPCIEATAVPVAASSIEGFAGAVEMVPSARSIAVPMDVTSLADRPVAAPQTI